MFINKTVFSIGLAINLKRHHYTETRLISSVKRYGDRIIWGGFRACVCHHQINIPQTKAHVLPLFILPVKYNKLQ